MGGKLRSGRKIASLSPPNKRAGGNVTNGTRASKDAPKALKADPTGATKAASKATPKPTVQNSAKGRACSAPKEPLNNNALRKGKKVDEVLESESGDEDDEENSGSDNESEGDGREERDMKKSNFSAPTPKRTNASNRSVKKADSSDEDESEEEQGSDEQDMDDDDDSDESDEEMKKVAPTPLKKSPLTHNDDDNESSDDNEDSDEESSTDAKDNGFTDGT